MRVVVDLDGMVYRCGFAAEHHTYVLHDWNGNASPEFDGKKGINAYVETKGLNLDECRLDHRHEVEPVENAIHVMQLVMDRIAKVLKPDVIVPYLSGSDNFRYDIATIKPYKGNRLDKHKPTHYQALRDFAVSRLGAVITENMEADDALAIDQTKYNPDCCIVSNDKDMLQVPGQHYDWVKNEHHNISREQGIKKLYVQIIAGDSTDNIQGVRGLGTKKAENLILGCRDRVELDHAVCDAYSGDYDAALENARLVYVLRSQDDMFEFPHWHGGNIVTGADASDELHPAESSSFSTH